MMMMMMIIKEEHESMGTKSLEDNRQKIAMSLPPTLAANQHHHKPQLLNAHDAVNATMISRFASSSFLLMY